MLVSVGKDNDFFCWKMAQKGDAKKQRYLRKFSSHFINKFHKSGAKI